MDDMYRLFECPTCGTWVRVLKKHIDRMRSDMEWDRVVVCHFCGEELQVLAEA